MLIWALKDQQAKIRGQVAKALGDKYVLFGLLVALKDKDPPMCSIVVEALGLMGDRSAILCLIEALKGPEESVLQKAKEALVKLE